MISNTPNITNKGAALLRRAEAGEEMTFTRFKIGDGSLGAEQDANALSDLIHTKMSIPITDVDTSQEGLIAIGGSFDSGDVTENFAWRELGAFARGEDGEEILYAYVNDGEQAGMLRVLNTEVLTEQEITMIFAIGEAEHVSAVYSQKQQYAAKDHTHSVVGTYTGDGAGMRLIELGFRASAVMLTNEFGQTYHAAKGVCGGLAVDGRGLRAAGSASADHAVNWNNDYTALLISDGGFFVNFKSASTAEASISTNENGVIYHYIAYK